MDPHKLAALVDDIVATVNAEVLRSTAESPGAIEPRPVVLRRACVLVERLIHQALVTP